MIDCEQATGAGLALLGFFLAGAVAPMDVDRWWTLLRFFLVMFLFVIIGMILAHYGCKVAS